MTIRKIAIIGMTASRADAPWDDPSWEKWCCNDAHRGMTPADIGHVARWFQIHAPEGCNASELHWMQLLNASIVKVPTYVSPKAMATWSERFPQAAEWLRPYPAATVRQAFPHGWYANTFCLEIALALIEDVECIGLWGVECTSYGREVTVERPAVAWWLGVAAALSVHVELPQSGSTLRPYPYMYGIDYWEEARAAAELNERILPPIDFDRVNLDTIAAVDAAEAKHAVHKG